MISSNSAVSFLKEVREEVKKVVWPSRQETIRMTAIVVGASAVVGIYLTMLDYILNRAVGLIVGR